MPTKVINLIAVNFQSDENNRTGGHQALTNLFLVKIYF